MKSLLSLILVVIFSLLSLLHFYWAIGGEWGFNQAIPIQEDGRKLINPGPISSAAVGFLLGLCGYYYLSTVLNANIRFVTPWLMTLASWLIPIVFILRSIGDFKYVGFFKSHKLSEFAQMDSNLYSPLCLFLGIAGIIIIAAKS